jgi:hypothetical protein
MDFYVLLFSFCGTKVDFHVGDFRRKNSRKTPGNPYIKVPGKKLPGL